MSFDAIVKGTDDALISFLECHLYIGRLIFLVLILYYFTFWMFCYQLYEFSGVIYIYIYNLEKKSFSLCQWVSVADNFLGIGSHIHFSLSMLRLHPSGLNIYRSCVYCCKILGSYFRWFYCIWKKFFPWSHP